VSNNNYSTDPELQAKVLFLRFKTLSRNETIYASFGGGATDNGAKWWKVSEIISAKMNIYTLQNDIALVRIPVDVELEHQQVIQCAKKMPSSEGECVIYGYGSSSYETNTITSKAIRYGRVDLISYERCEEILGRVMSPTQGLGQFCALGRNGVDACNGE
jgi:Trypsin